MTTTIPPPVWIVREDQATSLVGGVEVDDEPGEVDDEEDGIVLVDEVLVLLDEEPGAAVVAESEVLDAGATWSGGLSLTWASAALTICQVIVVARAATSTHAAAIVHLVTYTLSQVARVVSSRGGQGLLKARGQKSTPG